MKLLIYEKPKILISHSSLDKEFCDVFVDFLVSLGFSSNTIIYTSKSEFGVPSGYDIYDYLRKYLNRKILVFFMLSKNFYGSATCLNEMGAVWVKQIPFFSVLLPEFEHKDMKGVINLNEHTLDLCDPIRLTELVKIFCRTWGGRIDSIEWESIKNNLINKMKKFYT